MNLSNIPTEWLMALYIVNGVFSAFVQSLIPPDTTSSKTYIVLYRFLNLIAADFKSFSAPIPPPLFKATAGTVVAAESTSQAAATAAVAKTQDTIAAGSAIPKQAGIL